MIRGAGRVAAAAVATWLCLTGAEAVRADPPVRLGVDEMRNAAMLSLRSGQPAQALVFSDALLTRDRDDRNAHLIRARALRDLGRPVEAKAAARAAWALADSKEQRYATAMVMAQALSSAGQRTRAQWWLRRAVQEAPSEALADRAIRDFKYVRARNPWLTRLSFSVTPDSNINNGSSSRSSFLNYEISRLLFGAPVEYELGGTALALPGVEYALGIDTRYRFAESPRRAHDLVFSADLRHYTLNSEAKQIAPGAKGSDFAFASYTFGYATRGLNLEDRGEYTFTADLGQSWYSGNEYARFGRLSVGQSYFLTPATRVHAAVSGEKQIGINTNDLNTLRADVSVSRILPSGALVRLIASGATSTSPVASEEFTGMGLRAQLLLARPVLGAEFVFELGYRARDYDVSPHSPDGRHDRRLGADVTLIFSDIDYYGFNPTMTIYGSVTDSNIGLYDADRSGINFGIQSAF
ncbi:MAG: tetratricopeptide repeat protein [Jhaorihella sp.]